MKHTNFIPIDLYSPWKDASHSTVQFQKKNASWLLYSLMFLMSCMANFAFASEYSESNSFATETTTSIEESTTLLNFDSPTSNLPLTGSGIACNSHIYVSLGDDCKAGLTPDMILEGVADADLTKFIVNIIDGPNSGMDTVTLADLNDRIRVEVIDTSITPNNKCWGYVTVEDKIAPILMCSDTTILCNTSTDPAVIGGQPSTSDACAGGVTFTYSDVTESFSCLVGTGTTPDTISRITRTWQGTDASGNSSTCTQTIHVVKPQLSLSNIIWPADTVLYCGDNPSTEPSSTGFPQVMYNGETVSIDQFCLFGLNYTDQEFTTSNCVGTRKILRTWTIFDWCRPNMVLTNAISPGAQLVKIEDTVGPEITDLPVVTEIQVSFPDLNACAATITVPPVVVNDACSPTDSIHVKVQVGNTTINTNGGTLTNVPFGPQMVIYTATDDCGNFTQDTVLITINDNIAPTVICKENIVVALTQSGTAQVLAQAFDNGSYDNCSLDSIRVRRMDSCGVVMDLPFERFVEFQCCDVGREVMVQLSAWDTVGNTNSCMVRVQVQDKVAPVITCPPNDTVDCDVDLTDLSIFGPATVSGGSCNATSLDLVETRNLDNCGVGSITRTWTVPNTTISCTQTITVNLVPSPSFNVTRIPDSLIYVQCSDGIDIENLGQDSLQVESSGCQLLAVNYSQQVFNTDGECKEVLRRWQVIDWCQNPQANPLLPGYEEYTQIVKLIDNTSPEFTNILDTMIINADHTECNATVVLPTFLASDPCGSTPDISISGIIANSEGGNDTLTNAEGGTVLLGVPVGTYTIFYTASDGCNNSTTTPLVIVVRDIEGPTIFCDDLVTTLTLNGDAPVDSESRGWVTVWASDFNCKISDCNPDGIVQTLRFPSLGIGQSSPPADTTFGWPFNCGTSGEQVGDLWVRDGSGNWDYVRVTVNIQDNMEVCPDGLLPSRVGMVSGTIQNEVGDKVEEVTVNVGGYNMAPEVTGIDGNYEFELPMESNYTVAPEKNMEPLNGVSTFDLVLISKHILGLNKLDSPYKHIAADVNRSGTITAYDLVQLRQLILNVKTEFSNNDSWRFVDANYNFITDNPAAESFSEIASIGNLGDNVEAHFIAVKIGDVNVTAVANRGLVSSESRTNGTIALTTEEYTFEEGTTFSADFKLADLATVEGYQFTMNLDLSKVEIIDIEEGVAKDANFGTTMMNRGILTTSWNQGADVAQNEERMFSVVLKAKEAGKLSEVVNITSDLTQAEAYNTDGDLLNIALAFNDNVTVDNEFTLYNNKPNPFKEQTIVSFDLPKAGNARLTIFDFSGRIVKAINKEFGAGYNEIHVDKGILKGSGIYFYQLETATHTAKKKMILID